MSKKKDFYIGKFFWLTMPFDKERLSQIPESHRIRPYYIFAKASDNEYYGFPCSSQRPKDFTFSNNWVETNDTNIEVSECFKFSKNLLTKDNMGDEISKLSLTKKDELMKKIYNNYNYKNYPVEVKNIVNDYIDNCEYTNKDILYNGRTKEYIIVVARTSRYLCIKLSYLPTAGYAEMMLDGYKVYLDVLNPFYLNDLDEYVLSNISSVYEDVFRQKEDDIVYTKNTLNTSTPENLPLGSVISTVVNDKTYMLIKIGQHEKGIDYLVREKNAKGQEYALQTISYNFALDYKFLHILGDEKLSYAKTRVKTKK